MMRPTIVPLAILSAVGLAACAAGDVEVRSIATPLASGSQTADFRLGEGNAQLALGNVGLALEAYRKALREAPASIDAMVGIATCYDRMGRFDLSRKHYEMALAVEPDEPALYAALAHSLQLQGRPSEAARVTAELASRIATPGAVREAVAEPALPPPPAPSVTVALAPARAVPAAVEPHKPGVRLERLSMGEVALLTQSRAEWEVAAVAVRPQSTTIHFSKRAAAPVTLLNAARVAGLAARTRDYLARRGFTNAAIGDAPAVRSQSVIRFADADRARAERIAAQFGFTLERDAGAGEGMTVLLGRDAALDRSLARKAT